MVRTYLQTITCIGIDLKPFFLTKFKIYDTYRYQNYILIVYIFLKYPFNFHY